MHLKRHPAWAFEPQGDSSPVQGEMSWCRLDPAAMERDKTVMGVQLHIGELNKQINILRTVAAWFLAKKKKKKKKKRKSYNNGKKIWIKLYRTGLKIEISV